MRIALLGTRGIPARYGGFETFAEELSIRLVERGHQVTVYCRQRHSQPSYRGVRLVYLPTIRHKYLDTVAHTFLCTIHVLFHPHDVLLYCNGANALFTFLPRLTGMPTALNVDGLEKNRRKWNRLAKGWYHLSEWLSTVLPSAVVTDARAIADYYHQRYKHDSTFIPYGAECHPVASTNVLHKLHLLPREYFLYVSRMEPENNALLVREAFEKVQTSKKLALIGDAPYSAGYIAQVRDTTDPRIVMPGAIYGLGYQELQSHCFAYIHATEVGGTHPALIEAMGRGALTLYLQNPENEEVAGGAGIPFTPSSLTSVFEQVLSMSADELAAWRRRAAARVRERYDWDHVTSAYETLLATLINKS